MTKTKTKTKTKPKPKPRGRVRRPKTRTRCYHCGRRRLPRFIEWHPGIEEWQCTDSMECMETTLRHAGKGL